jgi:hypothetical protein
MTRKQPKKINIENVNHPGHFRPVDADMYEAMKRAFLKILPKGSPGLTEAEIRERVSAQLPEELFPGGAKAGWWTKAVQLDLEAKGLVAREKTKPLRWRKARCLQSASLLMRLSGPPRVCARGSAPPVPR